MEINPEMLLKAYAIGVFPMAESHDDPRMLFIDPDTRGVVSLTHPHIPRSLRKVVRRAPYEIRCDTAFEAVLDGCAALTEDRQDTWINPEIRHLYLELAALGRCHSVEVWSGETLVGGLYGVALGGAFFGESMFSRVTNASKIAMVHLIARLRTGGFSLLDCQFITDHLRQFGAHEISRDAYHTCLEEALSRPAKFYSLPDDGAVLEALLQSSNQTS